MRERESPHRGLGFQLRCTKEREVVREGVTNPSFRGLRVQAKALTKADKALQDRCHFFHPDWLLLSSGPHCPASLLFLESASGPLLVLFLLSGSLASRCPHGNSLLQVCANITPPHCGFPDHLKLNDNLPTTSLTRLMISSLPSNTVLLLLLFTVCLAC